MGVHLVVTDSGVGGLSACAALERALRESGDRTARLTYVNAWPSETGGYNDMPDIRAEAEVFDRALSAMARLQPDQVVVACNTLSIVYEQTQYYAQAHNILPPSAFRLPPVIGIVDAGVDLFHEALAAYPGSQIALFGTKTTIESGVHRQRLTAKGALPERLVSVGCHGLARSIETEMAGPATMQLIEECTARAAQACVTGIRRSSGSDSRCEGASLSHSAGVGRGFSPGSRDEAATLFLGVCCTHYTYLREEMKAAFERHVGRRVEVLDPTDRLVGAVVPRKEAWRPETTPGVVSPQGKAAPRVTVISKVSMPEQKRRMIAGRLAAVSPATARAVIDYEHVPDLF